MPIFWKDHYLEYFRMYISQSQLSREESLADAFKNIVLILISLDPRGSLFTKLDHHRFTAIPANDLGEPVVEGLRRQELSQH